MRRVHAVVPIVSNQFAFNLLCRDVEGEMLDWCAASEVSILAHSGLAQGLLAGRRAIGMIESSDVRSRSPYFSPKDRAKKEEVLDAVWDLSDKHQRPFSAISIRWVLDNPAICAVLIGIKNQQQLADNLQAVGWRLARDEKERLDYLSSLCPRGLAGTPAHGAPLS